jgi:hypothetical protein
VGSYNSEYENYYSNLRRKNVPGYHSKTLSSKKSDLSFIERRIITDLVGVLFLFCLVISCKLIVTPATRAVYQYSKNIVSENFDYKAAFNKAKDISVLNLKDEGLTIKEDYENKIGFWISKLKMEKQN